MNCFLAGLALALVPATARPAAQARPRQARLAQRLRRGEAEAQRTGKPIFLIFRCEP